MPQKKTDLQDALKNLTLEQKLQKISEDIHAFFSRKPKKAVLTENKTEFSGISVPEIMIEKSVIRIFEKYGLDMSKIHNDQNNRSSNKKYAEYFVNMYHRGDGVQPVEYYQSVLSKPRPVVIRSKNNTDSLQRDSGKTSEENVEKLHAKESQKPILSHALQLEEEEQKIEAKRIEARKNNIFKQDVYEDCIKEIGAIFLNSINNIEKQDKDSTYDIFDSENISNFEKNLFSDEKTIFRKFYTDNIHAFKQSCAEEIEKAFPNSIKKQDKETVDNFFNNKTINDFKKNLSRNDQRKFEQICSSHVIKFERFCIKEIQEIFANGMKGKNSVVENPNDTVREKHNLLEERNGNCRQDLFTSKIISKFKRDLSQDNKDIFEKICIKYVSKFERLYDVKNATPKGFLNRLTYFFEKLFSEIANTCGYTYEKRAQKIANNCASQIYEEFGKKLMNGETRKRGEKIDLSDLDVSNLGPVIDAEEINAPSSNMQRPAKKIKKGVIMI